MDEKGVNYGQHHFVGLNPGLCKNKKQNKTKQYKNKLSMDTRFCLLVTMDVTHHFNFFLFSFSDEL